MSQSRLLALWGYSPCPFLALRLGEGRHCHLERYRGGLTRQSPESRQPYHVRKAENSTSRGSQYRGPSPVPLPSSLVQL